MENTSKIFIDDISNYLNKEIITYFLVSQKELREGKNFYVRLKLSDKKGSISGNIWNNAKQLSEMFKEGDVVKIKGIVINYKGQYQLTINKIRTASDAEYDLSDFVSTTSKDINELSEQLFSFIDNISNKQIKELLLSFFDDKEFFTRFAKAPAAKSWHHNYVGGLIEHTVSVAKICEFSSIMYPVDKDLLIAGAILHDIGKVYEYGTAPVIEFTSPGRLLGHICIGDQMVSEKAKTIDDFSEEILMKLRHLILSHHGEYEKAAARLPQTIEAIVLHFADNLDAQTVGVKQILEASEKSESEWSEYDKLNNRYFYKGK